MRVRIAGGATQDVGLQRRQRCGDAARDDDHLGIEAVHDDGERGGERLAGVVHQRGRERVAGGRGVEHHRRSDRVGIAPCPIHEHRRRTVEHAATRLHGEQSAAQVRAETPAAAADASRAVELHGEMTELAGECVRAAQKNVAGHECPADLRADGDHRERGRAATEAKCTLAEGQRVDVVVDDGWQVRQRLDLLGDRHAMELGRVIFGARGHHSLVDVYRARESDADAVDCPATVTRVRAHLLDHGEQRLQRGARTRNVRWCLDGREHVTVGADESGGDRRSSDVDADRHKLAGERPLLCHRGL
jgi:hypothetical protein